MQAINLNKITNDYNIRGVNYFCKKSHLRCLIGFNYISEYVTINILKKLDKMNNTIFLYQLTILYTLFINS